MYNNFNDQNLQGNYSRNDMSYEFLGRSNPRQHDMRNFRSRGFVSNRFMGNNSQRRNHTARRAFNVFPNLNDTSISLEYANLQNSNNYYSNRTGNCVTNSRMYLDPNSTSNFNDPVNQSPDISSSTSPKKELNPKNEPHSDLIVQNTSSFEQITSLQDAEKNDSNLSKSETFQSTQLDTNSCENLVSIT